MIEFIIGGASLITGGVAATLYARKGLRSEKTCDELRTGCKDNFTNQIQDLKQDLRDNRQENQESFKNLYSKLDTTNEKIDRMIGFMEGKN